MWKWIWILTVCVTYIARANAEGLQPSDYSFGEDWAKTYAIAMVLHLPNNKYTAAPKVVAGLAAGYEIYSGVEKRINNGQSWTAAIGHEVVIKASEYGFGKIPLRGNSIQELERFSVQAKRELVNLAAGKTFEKFYNESFGYYEDGRDRIPSGFTGYYYQNTGKVEDPGAFKRWSAGGAYWKVTRKFESGHWSAGDNACVIEVQLDPVTDIAASFIGAPGVAQGGCRSTALNVAPDKTSASGSMTCQLYGYSVSQSVQVTKIDDQRARVMYSVSGAGSSLMELERCSSQDK